MNNTDLRLALERLVAERKRIGPSPALQRAVWGIPATTPPERRWLPRIDTGGSTMFSAVKFIAAGVIVALFGGFLLAGVLTTQEGDEMVPGAVTDSPAPTTTDDILPGVTLTVEEVGSGVYMVIADGVRDLVPAEIVSIAAGYDDGIWLSLEDEFIKLGSEESHAWPTVLGPTGRDLEVGPDGTFWTIPNPSLGDGWAESTGNDVFRSADGEEWSIMPCPDDCTGITIAPDGRAWASWRDGQGVWRVGDLGPESWQPLEGSIPSGFGPYGFYRLTITDSGDIYGVAPGYGDILYRYEDGTWHRIDGDYVMPIRVGRDGTAWGIGGDRWHRALVRFADGEWSRWTHDELPKMAWSPGANVGLGIGFDAGDGFRVAPDGSLWARLWRGGVERETMDPNASMVDSSQRFNAVMDGRAACDGVVRFDGLTTDHFLPGRCTRWDFAKDGSVWVLADADEGRDLYVITPEAVAEQ